MRSRSRRAVSAGVGELVAGSLDLHAGIVGLLQTFCSFVGLFEQHCATLGSSGALGNETKQDFAGIEGRVSEAPAPNPCSYCGPWRRRGDSIHHGNGTL